MIRTALPYLTAAVLAWAGVVSPAAAPLAPEAVPEPLRPWVPWVLHGEEEARCPLLTGQAGARRCAWPSRLDLRLGEGGGTFEQTWQVFAEGWVTLPGDARQWPQSVESAGAAVAVVEREGAPAVRLGPGLHRLAGRFLWDGIPETLQLPADVGLVGLTVEGTPRESVETEADGRLWVRRGSRPAGERPAEGLEVRVFRRLVDEVPFRVLTRVDLEVAGDPREVLLRSALPAGAIPVSLDSPLPARLEPDGALRVQVRAGRWPVTLAARLRGPVGELRAVEAPAPWPPEEVWVFEARPQLRVVEPRGLDPLDPRQTTLPADWQGLPTFRARAGDRLELAERRRGDPAPEPDRLSLERTVWLDFDGKGATVQDRMVGTMTRGWRVEAAPPLRLGRVAIDGEDRFITRLPGAEREGVEVRRGRLDLIADGRLEGGPSVGEGLGWDADFQRVGATVNLPPGWRLLAVAGADQVRGAWLERWTLFDLFLLLLTSAAVGKLWGWRWGAVALGALGLGYHESGTPREVWLYVLAAVALLRVVPRGRLRALVGVARWASLLALVVAALPFLVAQVRTAIFPVLERPGQAVRGAPPAGVLEQPTSAEEGALEDAAELQRDKRLESRRLPSSRAPAPPAKVARALGGYDPGVAVQTGPGLPGWSWDQARLDFSGPVERGSGYRLHLVGPPVTRAWHLTIALLLAALLARVAWPGRGERAGVASPAGTTAAALLLVLAGGALMPGPARADFPSPALLEALRERLVEAPECAPRCAELPRLRLDLAGDALRLRLEVLALAPAAVPLPEAGPGWAPGQVQVDGEPAPALAREPGGPLWLALGPGTHQVLIEGSLAGRSTLELALPLRPRRVEAQATGWRVEGLGADGVPEGVLRLARRGEAAPEAAALAPSALPLLLRVERTLGLGLDWRVDTRVVRLSPPGAGVVAAVPLLAGEGVTSPGVRVEGGQVVVSLGPQDQELAWASSLQWAATLTLEAPDDADRVETWRLDVGPTWHVRTSGLPPVHRDAADRWLPEWQPWPGERLTVEVTRPEGVPGPTLTVDAADLAVRPGRRSTDSELELRLRSSQGGQRTLRLPPGAELRSVVIDGAPAAVRQEGDRVVLPVRPGAQAVSLLWREPRGIGGRFETPAVDLAGPAVNAGLTVEVPRSRWVLLTGGPALGPAVLFWSLLVVVVAVAPVLSRLRLTPLRARHWALLGVGLTQAPVWSAALVAGWLLALGVRARVGADAPRWRFNLTQLGLAALSLAALGALLDAVRQGLLGVPDMQVAGNGSGGYLLRWYQDRTGPELPRAWVASAPLWVYRGLMLAWALWLAFALLGWLRWGWDCLRTGGLWRPFDLMPARLRRD